jgi:GT2 family glycosyltransferase
VFGASAGAALYRRAMLEEIGLFDQAFFMYLEDVDLAWRAQLAGWKALYAPQAVVYHLHSATAGQGSAFKRRLLGRNKLWLMAKNYPRHGLMRYLPAIVAYDAMAVAYTLLFQRDINPLKGRIEGLKGLRPMMKKRRRVQRLGASTAHVESTSLLEPLAPPWRVWERFAHLESPET